MSKIKCIISLLLIVILSGCAYGNDYIDNKEELVVFSGRNFSDYKYSNKVILHIRYGISGSDYLGVATSDSEYDEDWVNSAYKLLQGTFEKVCWNDFELIVFMKNTYYIFDINSYQIKDGINSADLKEYSITEFEKLYPENQTYNWWKAHDEIVAQNGIS